jgi:hypothetical protein
VTNRDAPITEMNMTAQYSFQSSGRGRRAMYRGIAMGVVLRMDGHPGVHVRTARAATACFH